MLSGYAYFPPVETVIRPETAIATGTSARSYRRRRPLFVLRPARYIVYPIIPPADAIEEIELAAISSALARQRRRARARLSPHHFVVYPLPPSLFLPKLRVTIAPSRRPKPYSKLRTPIVVGAAVQPAVPPRIAVRLAQQSRGKSFARYVFPIVVSVQPALGGTAIQLVRIWPSSIYSRLQPPVVVNP